MKKRVTQLIAAGAIVLLPTAGFAAGARITWDATSSAARYKLFVVQPDTEKVREFHIKNPHVTEDGYYYYDIHGIDPLQPTYFLMVSINAKGFSSGDSNLMELGSDSFCEIFDVDDDGKVNATDALAVARKALGLKHGRVSVNGSIILAFEILKMVATLQCR